MRSYNWSNWFYAWLNASYWKIWCISFYRRAIWIRINLRWLWISLISCIIRKFLMILYIWLVWCNIWLIIWNFITGKIFILYRFRQRWSIQRFISIIWLWIIWLNNLRIFVIICIWWRLNIDISTWLNYLLGLNWYIISILSISNVNILINFLWGIIRLHIC